MKLRKTVFSISLAVSTLVSMCLPAASGYAADMNTHASPSDTGTVKPVIGDANGDGIVDASDYLTVKLHVLGELNLDESRIPFIASGENGVTSADSLRIKQKLLGFTMSSTSRYTDIKALGAVGDGKVDCSTYFSDKSKGYIVNDGVYCVDNETANRLASADVVGNGVIKCKDFKLYYIGRFTSKPMDGTIPVSKLKDPLYTSMNLPHEAENIDVEKRNALNMNAASDKYQSCNAMGAICLTSGRTIGDDEYVTFCFGRAAMAVKTTDRDWYLAQDEIYPVDERYIYDFPWLSGDDHHYRLGDECVRKYADHVEVTVKGSYFNHGVGTGAQQGVLHYWNRAYQIPGGGGNLLGMAVMFNIWVKDPQYSGKFNTAPSADFYGTIESGQVYEGRNYTITDSPRAMVGHNVGNADYDEIMNSDKVQQLFGMK